MIRAGSPVGAPALLISRVLKKAPSHPAHPRGAETPRLPKSHPAPALAVISPARPPIAAHPFFRDAAFAQASFSHRSKPQRTRKRTPRLLACCGLTRGTGRPGIRLRSNRWGGRVKSVCRGWAGETGRFFERPVGLCAFQARCGWGPGRCRRTHRGRPGGWHRRHGPANRRSRSFC